MAGISWDEIDDEQLWAHLTIARGVDPGTAVPLSRATTELHPPTIYHWLRPGDAKRQRRVSGDPLFYGDRPSKPKNGNGLVSGMLIV